MAKKDILAKTLEAEKLRLEGLKRDLEFQQDLKQLEELARAEQPLGWRKGAELFLKKWRFKPYLTRDNRIELFFRLPVSGMISLVHDKRIKWKPVRWNLDTTYYPLGEVAALAKRQQALLMRGRRQARRRLQMTALSLRALDLKARGLTNGQIAHKLWPPEWKGLPKLKKRWTLHNDPRLRGLIEKHHPAVKSYREAEKLATVDLRRIHKEEASTRESLLARVRYLLNLKTR